MKTIIFISAVCFGMNFAFCQTEKFDSISELRPFSDSVMKLMNNEQYGVLFKMIENYLPIDKAEFKTFESKSAMQIEMIKSNYGDVIGFAFIKEVSIGAFAINHYFTLNFERWMLRVRFKYYRGKENWILAGFEWDDKVENLYE